MGYEKFVKKIFPFIGNQYNDVEEAREKPLPPGIKKIVMHGDVFLSPEEELWYFDLAHCKVAVAIEDTLPIGVLATTAKVEEEEGALTLGLVMYASEEIGKAAYGEILSGPLPWAGMVFDRVSGQTDEGEITIDDIANATKLQLVWGDEIPNGHITEEQLGQYTEDELRALVVATIYYE